MIVLHDHLVKPERSSSEQSIDSSAKETYCDDCCDSQEKPSFDASLADVRFIFLHANKYRHDDETEDVDES